MAMTLFFPGQGSQSVGMGKELAENFTQAKEVFEQVDDALGEKLSSVIWEGPEDQLTLTANTQPALMAVSMAVIKVLEAQGFVLADTVNYVAGHSLGEYSALAAVGALNIEQTARLLRTRGSAMQEAVPVGEGAMAAILGLSFDDVVTVTQEANKNASNNEMCQVANDNSEGQIVISGHAGAVGIACELAKEKGAKRALGLPVSAPFHSALMAPAAEAMKAALANETLEKPAVSVVCNVTARPEQTPEALKANLVEQVTGSVRWRETMNWLNENGQTHFVEVGAGKVLSGLIKRANREATVHSLNSPADIEAFLASL